MLEITFLVAYSPIKLRDDNDTYIILFLLYLLIDKHNTPCFGGAAGAPPSLSKKVSANPSPSMVKGGEAPRAGGRPFHKSMVRACPPSAGACSDLRVRRPSSQIAHWAFLKLAPCFQKPVKRNMYKAILRGP